MLSAEALPTLVGPWVNASPQNTWRIRKVQEPKRSASDAGSCMPHEMDGADKIIEHRVTEQVTRICLGLTVLNAACPALHVCPIVNGPPNLHALRMLRCAGRDRHARCLNRRFPRTGDGNALGTGRGVCRGSVFGRSKAACSESGYSAQLSRIERFQPNHALGRRPRERMFLALVS